MANGEVLIDGKWLRASHTRTFRHPGDRRTGERGRVQHTVIVLEGERLGNSVTVPADHFHFARD